MDGCQVRSHTRLTDSLDRLPIRIWFRQPARLKRGLRQTLNTEIRSNWNLILPHLLFAFTMRFRNDRNPVTNSGLDAATRDARPRGPGLQLRNSAPPKVRSSSLVRVPGVGLAARVYADACLLRTVSREFTEELFFSFHGNRIKSVRIDVCATGPWAICLESLPPMTRPADGRIRQGDAVLHVRCYM